MDDSFAVPSEGILISSVLGVKSSLRFCHHHSNSKAHVILRRVDPSDDSSDDEEGQSSSSRVHFKLFAQKRFTITAGKEILLTVEDERFKDRPVLLTGIVSSDNPSELSEGLGDGDIPPLPKNALPPKMRRAWVKKPDEGSTVEKTSIGVQATPHTSSIHIQAQPSLRAVSVQLQPSVSSASVQTFSSLRSMYVQTEFSPYLSRVDTSTQHTKVQERSLSPMDLDSPVESSALSPRPPHPMAVKRSPSHTSLPEMLPLSKPGSSNDEDEMQISPITSSSSREDDIIPKPVPSPEEVDSTFVQNSHSASPLPILSLLHSTKAANELATKPSEYPKTLFRKSPVYNPFVSGGFMTEFTGEMRTVKDGIDQLKTDDSVGELSQPAHNKSPFLEKSVSAKSSTIASSKSPLLPSQSQASTILRSPVLKVKEEPREDDSIDQVVAQAKASVPIKSIPTGPRNTVVSSSKTSKDLVNVPRAPRSLRIKDEGSAPAPKAVAVVSSASYSNPLGIRPSAPPTSVPSGPKALTGTQPKRKLVIGVGAGLPLVRGISNVNSSRKQSEPNTSYLVSYPSPSPPSNTPPPPISTPPVESPRPPPPPVQIKWKRLDAIDANVTSSTNSKEFAFQRISPTDSNSDPLAPKEKSNPPSLVSPSGSFQDSPKSFPLNRQKSNGTTADTKLSPLTPASVAYSQSVASTSNHDIFAENQSAIAPLPFSQPIISTVSSPTTQSSASPRNAAFAINPSKLPPVSMPFSVNPPLQLVHPLPPKPVVSPLQTRGTKRERPSSPSSDTVEAMRKHKRMFRWPTLESNYSIYLKGEGDLNIVGISASSDGGLLALNCADKTIRIWNNQTRTEMARLSHNAKVTSVLWLEDDGGVVSLGEDGMISKWARTSYNHWQWAKVVDIGIAPSYVGGQSGMRLAYHKDKIAVSLPAEGIKIWFWVKGSWQAQRSILRSNTTALMFIDDGSTLLGGTVDGVLWSCEVPNGTLRAWSFLKTRILSIDINPARTHVLISCPGVCRLVGLRDDRKGKLEQSFSNKETEAQPQRIFGALFTARGQGVLFGDVKGCALIWDTKKGTLVYGLDHGLEDRDRGEDEEVTAAASLDVPNGGCIVTGTKAGLLSWWSQPAYTNTDSSKKSKVS
ncbi:hypothetical protein GYMLUDRAFT_206476 [Collybiopsis luxurians FD-317 M1]|uniref:WD40 repeat-like protein n=1 Tax=Collybiopsis luxurians FD-317 M1 TaxID=944289 RepID=A0A0D0CHX6_9AGAR|nr:hypothetical protein GYMLUDRAFT_206476 [Collybiopsis luxurians FD-317 M1]